MAETSDLTLIRDQREMVGERKHGNIDDVEAAWQEWADAHGFPRRLSDGDGSRDFRESDRIVRAYISGSAWVADCPVCNGGIAAWRENPRGACLDCGTIFPVEHPPEDDARRAVEILSVRPDPATRSWNVHRGETVDDLAVENDARLDPAGGVI